jgi:hypothetical protein
MTLPKGHGQTVSTAGKRNFDSWWATVPEDLRQKTRKGDEGNKPLLNQVNYVLLHLHLAGKHDAKPSHEELKDWLQWPSRCSQNGSKNKIITDLQDPDSV